MRVLSSWRRLTEAQHPAAPNPDPHRYSYRVSMNLLGGGGNQLTFPSHEKLTNIRKPKSKG